MVSRQNLKTRAIAIVELVTLGMSHTLLVEIPEEAYEELIRSADQKGRTPERIAAEILADSLSDPVMKLAGCISTPFTDAGERHDDYIGSELLRQHE